MSLRSGVWFVWMSCLVIGLGGCDSDPGADAGGGASDAGPRTVDAGGTDAGPIAVDSGTDAGPADAGPMETGHCAAVDLILEAVDPGTSITVFNPTAAPIDTTNYVFCQQPIYPSLGSIEAGVTIAPGANHMFAWPSGFSSTDAGGEIAFYRMAGFSNPDNQIDFVCWGVGASPSRKNVAEMDGDWSGDCAGAVTGGSIRRVPESDGRGAASYDPSGAAAALSCP